MSWKLDGVHSVNDMGIVAFLQRLVAVVYQWSGYKCNRRAYEEKVKAHCYCAEGCIVTVQLPL